MSPEVHLGFSKKVLTEIMVSRFPEDWRDIPHYCPGTGMSAPTVVQLAGGAVCCVVTFGDAIYCTRNVLLI
jgi:hypothetical protein